MEKIKAKVEQVLHKDKDTTHTGTHGTTATGAPHSSHTANTVDPTVSTGHTGTHTGTHSGTHTGGLTGGTHTGQTTGTTGHSDPTGPHDSHLANKADPRIDSDRVGGYGNTSSTGGGYNSGTHTTGTTTGGLTGGTHTGTHGYSGSDLNGPHDSNLLNKADPRVDSSRPGQGYDGNFGNTGNTHGGLTGGTHTGTHAGGLTGGTHSGTHGYGGSDPNGPHDSNLLNKADPRVDSSRPGQGYDNNFGNTGNTHGGLTGGTHTGTHAGGLTGGTHSGTHGYGSDPNGPHDSHLANRADPRVDASQPGGYGNTGGYSSGTHTGGLTGGNQTGGNYGSNLPGSAPNTAGPHKTDMANKLDPRVDSDLDGSRKVGGDRTFN